MAENENEGTTAKAGKARQATEAAPVAAPKSENGAQDKANLDGGDLNPVALGVGLQSRTGERTGGIVDEDGNEVSLDSALDMGDGSVTYVTVTKRLFESFYLPGSNRPLSRLLYGEGARISRETAESLKAATAK